MNKISPIIHTTNNCNMGCKYCYAGSAFEQVTYSKESNKIFKNNIDTLYKFIDDVIDYNGFEETAIIFHGGEPLLINPENYESVFQYFKHKGYNLNINFQTNGTLINDEFIRLFKKYKVNLGVSLDGPKNLNDQFRVFKNGKGTFNVVYENLLKLKKENINFGCLLTLQKENIKEVELIYSFFKENNIAFNIRPIFETAFDGIEKPLITSEEYSNAFCSLFNLWFNDEDCSNEEPLIKDFENIISQLIEIEDKSTYCGCLESCSRSFIAFDMNGDIYHCNRLFGEQEFYYGNIKKDKLSRILDKTKHLSCRWDKLSKSECSGCEIAKLCYGGCPGNGKHYYGDYFMRDYYCSATKMTLGYVYEKVKSTL